MTRRGRDEQGSVVIETVFLMGFTLLLLLAFANLAFDGLVKGIVHSAADQGVRAGARQDVDSARMCEARARQVMGNVLAGPAGRSATLSCGERGGVVTSQIHIILPAWVPMFRASDVTVTAQARKERT